MIITYKDPVFEILYLAIGSLLSIYLICKAKKRIHYYMFGFLGLLLMLNDLCAFFPSFFDSYASTAKDYLTMVGIGKDITTVLLTVLLVVSFWIYKLRFHKKTSIHLDLTIYVLAFLKIVTTIIPDEISFAQNPYAYGILTNIPLIALLVLAIIISYRLTKHDNDEMVQYTCAVILSVSLMSENTAVSFKSVSLLIALIFIPIAIISTYLLTKNLSSIRKLE